jgi:hypothetical protein
MKSKYQEIAQRRARLSAISEAQRQQLKQEVQSMHGVFVMGDAALAAARFVRSNIIVVLGIVFFVALRRKKVLPLLTRAVTVQRALQTLRIL